VIRGRWEWYWAEDLDHSLHPRFSIHPDYIGPSTRAVLARHLRLTTTQLRAAITWHGKQWTNPGGHPANTRPFVSRVICRQLNGIWAVWATENPEEIETYGDFLQLRLLGGAQSLERVRRDQLATASAAGAGVTSAKKGLKDSRVVVKRMTP
jgi:hypothetical protein